MAKLEPKSAMKHIFAQAGRNIASAPLLVWVGVAPRSAYLQVAPTFGCTIVHQSVSTVDSTRVQTRRNTTTVCVRSQHHRNHWRSICHG